METKWEIDVVEKENLIEFWDTAEYNEKLLTITLIYKDNPHGIAEATIKSRITSPNQEGKLDMEYFEQKCYVGFKDNFYQEMLDKVVGKHLKLEKIAAGKDE